MLQNCIGDSLAAIKKAYGEPEYAHGIPASRSVGYYSKGLRFRLKDDAVDFIMILEPKDRPRKTDPKAAKGNGSR